MPTRKDIIEYCMTLGGVYEDYPFDDPNWTLMRHVENKKTFAFIFYRCGELYVNVKCEPMKADFLRNTYDFIIPAYHMNKTHWNSLIVNSADDLDMAWDMIADSFELTRPKLNRKKPPRRSV